MLENFGHRPKTARVNANLSRKQVAQLSGVSVSTIGFYETGERTPSLEVLLKLATHYKVSVDFLLDTSIDKQQLSLEGLTEQQVKALRLTADCFRNMNH